MQAKMNELMQMQKEREHLDKEKPQLADALAHKE